MAILHTRPEHSKTATIACSVLFSCAAAMYFIPADIPHKIAFPLGILAVSALWLCPWQIFLAMAFSAAGDLCGSFGSFMGQMGAFAAAHIMFIWFFIGRYFKKVEPDFKLTGKAKGFLAMVLLCTGLIMYVAFTRIIPGAPAGAIRIGAGIYACLICMMLVTAMLQRSSLFALGALLFVFSDFILAWNRFSEPIENARVLIMVPYYLGQWLIYIRSASFRVGPEMRLMRF